MSEKKPSQPSVERPQQRNIPSGGGVHPTSKAPNSNHTANVPKNQTVHPVPPPKKK